MRTCPDCRRRIPGEANADEDADMRQWALADRLNFGNYTGATISEVIADDPSYLEWARDEIDGFELDEEAQASLDKCLGFNDPLENLF